MAGDDRRQFDDVGGLPPLDFGDDARPSRRPGRSAPAEPTTFDFDDPDETRPNPRVDASKEHANESATFRLITVCTHNRTRSVMSMAMLQAGFDQRVGEGRVVVSSLGFGPPNEAPIPDAIDAMGRRSLDVTAHRSRQVSAERVRDADLILTSERDHVVKIASAAPDVFAKTFTLPEFVERASDGQMLGRQPVRSWIEDLGRGRSASAYLSASVPEVIDPTGSPARQFEAATVGIEILCDGVVAAIGRHL